MAYDISRRATLAVLLAPALIAPTLAAAPAMAAATAGELDAEAAATLQKLYATSSRARELSAKSVAILVFPKIKKAGFMVGGQGGKGVLTERGRTVGYYSIYAGSVGLQAGVQTFSYVLFFVTHSALAYLKKSDGWAIGSGPSVVVVDEGMARTMNTTTLGQDVYAMPFGQKGLMAGMGLEGSKITPIHPDR